MLVISFVCSRRSALLSLAGIDLAAQASGGVVLEEAGKDWLEEGSEDDLGATAEEVSK